MSKVEPVANGLTLRTLGTQAMVQVTLFERTQVDALLRALAEHIGLADAHSPRRAARSGSRVSYRVAPTRWLLCDKSTTEDALMNTVRGMVPGSIAVTGFGAGRSVERLQGRHARTVLAKGCAVDLHPGVFAADHFAHTIVAHVPCLVHRVDEADLYDLHVPRSYAESVREWLLDAAAEFSPAVIDQAAS